MTAPLSPDERLRRRRASVKRWADAHRDYLHAKQKERLQRDGDRIRAIDRERHAVYRTTHPDIIREQMHRANVKRAAAQKNYQRAYRSNPDKISRIRERSFLTKARRRALEGAALGSHTMTEWVEKRAMFGDACFYCQSRGPLSRDHMTPLSRGGCDYIWNIVPACRPCNSRKHARTAEEFLDFLGREAAA